MTLIVANQFPFLVAGLCQFLEEEGHSVETVMPPVDILDLPKVGSPRLLLIGLLGSGERTGGLSILQVISKAAPALPAIVLTPVADCTMEVGVRNLGARGLLTLAVGREECRAAINAVLGGGHWFQAQPRPGTCLTRRQLEAIQALARLDSHKAAAAALGISRTSFERHLAEARSRLGGCATIRLVAEAERRLLLVLPPESLALKAQSQ